MIRCHLLWDGLKIVHDEGQEEEEGGACREPGEDTAPQAPARVLSDGEGAGTCFPRAPWALGETSVPAPGGRGGRPTTHGGREAALEPCKGVSVCRQPPSRLPWAVRARDVTASGSAFHFPPASLSRSQ